MGADKFSQYSIADLQQMRANAMATTGCLGHHKGNMNDLMVNEYGEEILVRGETPWSKDKCWEDGRFNGNGSF